MPEDRRSFFKQMLVAGLAAAPFARGFGNPLRRGSRPKGGAKTVRVSLVQFDAVPEQIERNIEQVERLSEQAVSGRARWVMFHEATLSDYTPKLVQLAEPVPYGKSTRRIEGLARRLGCYISFGLSEADRGRYYITQVFVGPKGFVYRYRKTWIWREKDDGGYRNEWARYDPGSGPELFLLDGVKATCFICSDGEAPRCIERAAQLAPQVVFYPNNRGSMSGPEYYGERARAIRAPMLVTNRVGQSWLKATRGGSSAYAADGTVLAQANREGREEILFHDLEVRA